MYGLNELVSGREIINWLCGNFKDLVDFIEFLVELEWDELKMAIEEINKAYGNSEIE